MTRMLTSEDGATYQADVARVALPFFHRPFLQRLPSNPETERWTHSPSAALTTLQTFLTHADPSPALISKLLTPIIPALFTLSSQLGSLKVADPSLRTSLQGFLGIWGRVVGLKEGIASLWLVIEGEGGDWQVDVAGEIKQKEDQ